MSIKIYGFWRSIASFRVRVALRLKGLPFEEIPIDILSGEQFEPDYAAVNAERVVPTFIHDGHSVFQSLAIIEYLDEIQPTPRLIPQDAKERAYARSLALMTIAGAHHDEVGAEDVDHICQLMIGENHGVEIDLPQIGRRRQWQFAMLIVPRPPGVIDPAGITGKVAAAMHRHQFQIREARQRSREDEIVKCQCRVEGIAEDIVEIEMGQALAMGESVRMHHDERAELLGLGKEGTEFRIG